MNPELDGDAQVVDEGRIFYHIVCHAEMLPNYIDESISLGEDHNDTSPTPLRLKEPSKYMHQCSRVVGIGGCCVLVHYAVKSANV
jgi:hypothetical protein